MGRKAKKGYGQLAKENSWLRRELHFLRIRLQNVHKEHAMKTTRMQKVSQRRHLLLLLLPLPRERALSTGQPPCWLPTHQPVSSWAVAPSHI